MTALAQDFDWGEWTDIVEALESSARKRLEKVKSLIDQGYLVHAFSKAANNDKKSIGCDNPRVNDKSLRVNDLSLADLVGFVHQNQNDEQVLSDQLTLLPTYRNNVEKFNDKFSTLYTLGAVFIISATGCLGQIFPEIKSASNKLIFLEAVVSGYLYAEKSSKLRQVVGNGTASALKTLIDGGQMKIFEDTVIRAITAEMMEKKCTEHLRSLTPQPV